MSPPARGRASDAEGNRANPTGCSGPAGVLGVRTITLSQDVSSSLEKRRKTEPAPELGFPTPKMAGKQKGFGLVLQRGCHRSISLLLLRRGSERRLLFWR